MRDDLDEEDMREVTVEVDADVLQYCEQTVRETEFETVEEYIAYVLQAVTQHGEEATEGSGPEPAVREQLESLGYR